MCYAQWAAMTHWSMFNDKIKVQIVLYVCMSVCLFLNPLKKSKVRGWRGEEGGSGVGGGRSWPPPVTRAGSRCPGLEGVLWWCRRRRRWRGALCTPCYLLEALLVPSLAVDIVGGDLPPIWDVLADLGSIAVPLAPLAIGLGCREAHLVLL